MERRARLGCGQLYHPLPSDRELCSEVMSSCQLSLPEVWPQLYEPMPSSMQPIDPDGGQLIHVELANI